MSEIFKKPRGTSDYLYKDAEVFENVRSSLLSMSKKYGCFYIMVPTFEERNLFHRTTGESSDIVSKETFDLISKGDKEYTLRPEFTAGINRSIIENKLYASPDMPLRVSYFGPAFRYERPQAGRLREFNQFGVEYIDLKLDLNTIIDCIVFSYNSVKEVTKKEVKLKLNYLGSFSSREKYKSELKKFFSSKISSMCDDCKRRLEINPLRILDCKVKEDNIIASSAPKINDFLEKDDVNNFKNILSVLDSLKINYEVDNQLVRGLDYYTGIVWEIYSNSDNQIALGGGGQYSSLSKDIGGPELDGIGFSLGIERLILLCDYNIKSSVDIVIIDNKKDGSIFDIVSFLRDEGFSTSIVSSSRSIQGGLKMADRLNSKFAIIIDSSSYKIKKLDSREQIEVNKKELMNYFIEVKNA